MKQNIINRSGKEFTPDHWDAIVNMMDDEIREDLHSKLAPCTDQVFFTAYEDAHEAKYGEEWELSKRNPQW